MSVRSRVALMAAVALLPIAASATVVLKQTFEQMAATAHVIVRGKARPSQVRWDDAHARINTWTDLEVVEVLKGKVAGPVTIRQAGGVIGNVGMSVAGEASFKDGEEVLVFLERPGDDPNIFVVLSMSMGKITLEKDSFGELRAYRDGKGLGLYDPKAGDEIRVVNAREELGSAEPFLSRIRRAARAAQ